MSIDLLSSPQPVQQDFRLFHGLPHGTQGSSFSPDEIDNITQNSQSVESLFAPLYTTEDDNPVTDQYGTFDYSGSQALSIGDQLAVYVGTSPDERIATENYTDQPISYLTVTDVNGSTISYGNTDAKEVLFVPDVLPVDSEDDQDGDP